MRTNVMAAVAAVCALSWSGVSRGADFPGSNDDVMEGTVLKADKHVLLLKMHGALIPVHVTTRTHFEGGRDQLRQFAPGEQVRVSLRSDSQTLNEARSVGLSDNAQEGVGRIRLHPRRRAARQGGAHQPRADAAAARHQRGLSQRRRDERESCQRPGGRGNAPPG